MKTNQDMPKAKEALKKMKLEVASEFGFSNYESIDKGNLSAKENGSIGGEMTKRLINLAQQQMR